MTSVIGHVFSTDFLPQFQSWEVDPKDLFFAGIKKSEANPKDCAKSCHHIVLWLDCDREGENICFEVLECCKGYLSPFKQRRHVWRAKFSAISPAEIHAAMDSLVEPNENEALAVDARQELDLKVGVAFTRFQTRYFQGKYGDLDANIISYGPCQTPTLNFTVERHQRIMGFVPEPFWAVCATCIRMSGQRVRIEWARGRVFRKAVGNLLLARVQAAVAATVTAFSKDEARKARPHGLNTVALLKVASATLNIGPQRAMAVAEGLYIRGFLSYPRTESSAYPANFDFQEILQAQAQQPAWGLYACELLQSGFKRPQGGSDAGDHPPITPVAVASEGELGGGDEWRIYEYVARHFLGSISSDCVYERARATMQAGGETFTAAGATLKKPGFTAIMPWAAPSMQQLPELSVNERLSLKDVTLSQGKTSPPDYLTEAELIGLMEEHGIGTDASISVHVNNVCERKYVRVGSGRRVVPTDLGITLISGYQRIDPELCRPHLCYRRFERLVRAHVEAQIALVAAGKADKAAVVEHTLTQFIQKFLFFVESIGRMDSLFEASFSPLTASGKPFCLCGKCRRYMKYISARPQRLYCPTCEEIYSLPQGGDVKLLSGATCPLDGFELVMFSMGGADGKRYPLCPLCFSSPPFEDSAGGGSGAQGSLKQGMPCMRCAHPTCKHGFARLEVMGCPECEAGSVVLDTVSFPKWRLDCNRCNYLVYLPPDLHAVKVTQNSPCEECGSKRVALTWRKGHVPRAFPGGDKGIEACIVCNESVVELCEYRHSMARPQYKAREGRGRGRKGRHADAKMTFHGF